MRNGKSSSTVTEIFSLTGAMGMHTDLFEYIYFHEHIFHFLHSVCHPSFPLVLLDCVALYPVILMSLSLYVLLVSSGQA